MHGWDRRHRFDPDIKALLLIAGLSGSGKSTFIKQLRKKKLPADIARLLPPDIHKWRHAYGKKSLKDALLPGRRRIPPGQIFHFDMTTSSTYRRAVAEHRPGQGPDIRKLHPDEETLNAVLAAAETIRIVVVKPPKEQLVRQLSTRAAVIDLPPPLRPIASRTVPLVIGAKNLFRSGTSGKMRDRLGRKWARRAKRRNTSYRNCEFYCHQGAIDAVHTDWESAIHSRIGNRLATPAAYIEPVPGTLWRRTFRPLNAAPDADAAAPASPNAGSFARLENLASLLDNAIAIPGTRMSFGIDAIIGLVPIIGDAISGTVAGFIIWEARRLGAPRGMLARMIANATLDTLIGVIPIVGDVADAAYKSNVRNVTKLRRHLSGVCLMRGAVTA